MDSHVRPRTRQRPAPTRSRAGTGASGQVRKVLGPELISELERLCGRPTVGLIDVCRDVASIVAAAVLGILTGHVVGPVVAACYIGARQRYLSNLAHECVHQKLMVNRGSNRLIGYLLTGLLGEGLAPYRATHTVHHAMLGSEQDPMFQSYRSGDIRAAGASPSRAMFVRRVILRNALWHLPTSALRVLLTKAPEESWKAPVARAGSWAVAAAVCWQFGVVGDLLMFWFVPLVLVRPVVTWITDLGNHAGLIENTGDVLRQTRGWSSHWLTRHLLGGHLDDLYHPIHHWCPQIPWRRLPEAKALLSERLPDWGEVPWCSGYFFRRRSTPAVPCVVEHIIDCLDRQARITVSEVSAAAL